MRYGLIVLLMLLGSATSTMAQVSVGIGIALPGVSIGINLPAFPELVPVPGYPVYYAPRLASNFFFYDGMYWVYQDDNWYASSWYNGPWGLVAPEFVPLFVLRIPVRYYRLPPAYFRGWRADAPPRWDEHWGNEWAQHRSGWDKWDHRSAPAPAPLPIYQRRYSGDRYPGVAQQPLLHSQNYRYQPRDAVVRQHYQEQAAPRATAPVQRGPQGAPQERNPRQQDSQRATPPPPLPHGGPPVPRPQPPPMGGEAVQRAAPTQAPTPASPRPGSPAVQDQRQPPQQGAAPHGPQEPRRGQGQEKDRDKGEERGQERNR